MDNIIAASANSDLQVAEDIYDQSGNKLLAKGYKITPEIREKLLNKVLKKPIETCIKSENTITCEDISKEALLLFKASPLLNSISSNIEDEAKELLQLKIAPLASMLLTVMRDGGTNKFNHSLQVTLIARSIARNMNLGHQDMTNLTLSSLLHDVGELYASVPEKGELSKEDWRKVMAHPILGSSVVKLYMNYPVEVSAAIFEHHERCDGTGYPQKLNANNCSINGQILILSEAVAGILKSGVETQNMTVAFKMASDVYPLKPLNALNDLLKSLTYVRSEVNKNSAIDRLNLKMKTFSEVQTKIENLLNNNDIPVMIEESAKHLKFRIEKLKQSIYSSGIHYYLEDDSWMGSDDSQIIMLELEIATNETRWQILDMLRDLTLRLIDFKSELPTEFSEITEQLAQVIMQRNIESE